MILTKRFVKTKNGVRTPPPPKESPAPQKIPRPQTNPPTQDREGAMATRASSGMLNVNRNRGGTEVRNNFWSVRVVDSWNSLPDSVKSSASINIFKNSIDNLIEGGKI